MKCVRIYKQLKIDLYNWGQVINILRDFIIASCLIDFVFVCISWSIGGAPFILVITVTYQGSKHLVPTDLNQTAGDAIVLHLLTLLMSLMGFAFGILAYMMKSRRKVSLGYLLEKVTVLNAVLINIMLILVYFFGNAILGNV